MRIYLLIILTLIAFVGHSNAQVSGYQGKRLSLAYGVYIAPALSNPNKNLNTGVFKFNTRGVFKAKYVLSRKHEAVFGVGFFQTGFEANYAIDMNTNDIDGRPINGTYSPTADFGGQVYTFGMRFYNSSSIAPIGSYFEMGFDRYAYTIDSIKVRNPYFDNNTDRRADIVLDESYDLNALAFYMEYGKQRVFFDRLIWGYSIKSAWTFGSNILDASTSSASGIPEEYYQTESRERLLYLNLLQFSTSLSFLIY